MSNYRALELRPLINDVVLKASKDYSIDLNTVVNLTPNCLIIGEQKTGNCISISKFFEGVKIKVYNENNRVLDVVRYCNIPQRFEYENPTINKAMSNGFKLKEHTVRSEVGSPNDLIKKHGYSAVKAGFGFGLTTALYNEKGDFVLIGGYRDILKHLKGLK